MKSFVGREKEIALLNELKNSSSAEFVAIYGRRRVGKTRLVRHVFEKNGMFLEAIGKRSGKKDEQLHIFFSALRGRFPKLGAASRPGSWGEAFEMLSSELATVTKGEKCVVFLDELPWLATPRSGLIEELDRFWNSRWSRLDNLLLIVCGSAASWMLSKVVRAKGGLHNRLTRTIVLEPFDLRETAQLLALRGVELTHRQIIEIYMAMGGIPYYLENVSPGKSPAQVVDETCFRRSGLLFDEFEQVFPALFAHSTKHKKLIRRIAGKRYGVSREELIRTTKIPSGAAINRPLDELEAAGFIARFVPYGKKNRESYYRVVDEYSQFYLIWLDAVKRRALKIRRDHWLAVSQTPSWKSWAGYAFEGICQKHADQILDALGISGVHSEVATWRSAPGAERGSQIDLLFDRRDGIITVVEIKYAAGPVTINKKEAEMLRNRLAVFKEAVKTRKSVSLVMISPFGTTSNAYSHELLAADIKADVLFGR